MYNELKKNYPIYSRQFDFNLSEPEVSKGDTIMEPYEAILASKYLSTLDERGLAVDHRLTSILNKLHALTK